MSVRVENSTIDYEFAIMDVYDNQIAGFNWRLGGR